MLYELRLTPSRVMADKSFEILPRNIANDGLYQAVDLYGGVGIHITLFDLELVICV